MATPTNALNPVAPKLVIALMIGELRYQPTLNRISSAIVRESVALCRQFPDAILVCESQPMSDLALSLGIEPHRLRTALPQPSGHTTRKVAKWLQEQGAALPSGSWWMVTHTLHAPRAGSILGKCGIDVIAVSVAEPCGPENLDWKLRSSAVFTLYNHAAGIYCWLRGWT